MRAPCEARPERRRRATAHGGHLVGETLLAQPGRLLKRHFIEGGFIDILTPEVSTPLPSLFTRTLMLESTTRLMGTRICMFCFLRCG
jgi:hypothetical protein